MKPQMRVIFEILEALQVCFMVQGTEAAAERPSPIARLPQKMSLPDYWISVSFFFELS